MKIKEIPMSLDVVILIGVVLPWRDALLEDFFFLCKKYYLLEEKKQNVVARSTIETRYRTMTSLTCELIWVKQFL